MTSQGWLTTNRPHLDQPQFHLLFTCRKSPPRLRWSCERLQQRAPVKAWRRHLGQGHPFVPVRWKFTWSELTNGIEGSVYCCILFLFGFRFLIKAKLDCSCGGAFCYAKLTLHPAALSHALSSVALSGAISVRWHSGCILSLIFFKWFWCICYLLWCICNQFSGKHFVSRVVRQLMYNVYAQDIRINSNLII